MLQEYVSVIFVVNFNNNFSLQVIHEMKLDIIDLHFYFVNQIQRRAKDGRWDATAHR
jgi:hypothetical protein